MTENTVTIRVPDWFDAEHYTSTYPGAAKSPLHPFEHYLRNGVRRVLEPNKIEDWPYHEGGLMTRHNSDFRQDPKFVAAYQRGLQAARGRDYNWRWRVHIGLWAARTAALLPGDFVEFGVNVGFLSSAIMLDLDWNTLDRDFYLLDTFQGVDEDWLTDAERADGMAEKGRKMLDNGFYVTSADSVRENFSEWERVRIIEGSVPDTLPQIDSTEISYVHIDMNCAEPEVAALRYVWDRIVPGGVVLLDDYGWKMHIHQKHAMDQLATELGFHIACLPTGQGLVIKS